MPDSGRTAEGGVRCLGTNPGRCGCCTQRYSSFCSADPRASDANDSRHLAVWAIVGSAADADPPGRGVHAAPLLDCMGPRTQRAVEERAPARTPASLVLVT